MHGDISTPRSCLSLDLWLGVSDRRYVRFEHHPVQKPRSAPLPRVVTAIRSFGRLNRLPPSTLVSSTRPLTYRLFSHVCTNTMVGGQMQSSFQAPCCASCRCNRASQYSGVLHIIIFSTVVLGTRSLLSLKWRLSCTNPITLHGKYAEGQTQPCSVC